MTDRQSGLGDREPDPGSSGQDQQETSTRSFSPHDPNIIGRTHRRSGSETGVTGRQRNGVASSARLQPIAMTGRNRTPRKGSYRWETDASQNLLSERFQEPTPLITLLVLVIGATG
jgi:hypothetical protein